ncbi:hypothetical protein ACIP9H_40270 [Streptomyces sp. NPDC088732]|uniref:hypothetical protein n=1 Tax=Streptomyces sp. NPDC088732 TaxID=3365879 RepID=UPI003822AA8F
MRHITATTTPDHHGVELDISRDAERILDQVAALFSADPDRAEDILVRLGSAVGHRDDARAEGEDARADFAGSLADSLRDELLHAMGEVGAHHPVTVRLSANEAADLADETRAAADRTVMPPARPVHDIDRAPLTGGRGRVPEQRQGGAAA